MPTLKAEKETVFRVEAYSLSSYIRETLGKEFEVAAYLDGGHDSNHRFIVDGWKNNSALDKLYMKDWSTFLDGGKDPSVNVVLDGLCSQGLIAEGVYIIYLL